MCSEGNSRPAAIGGSVVLVLLTNHQSPMIASLLVEVLIASCQNNRIFVSCAFAARRWVSCSEFRGRDYRCPNDLLF